MSLPYRAWFYFRIGYGTYLAFVVNIIQFLLIGTLYVQRIPEFAGIHLTVLAAIFVLPFSIASIIIGVLHTRRQMRTDIVLSTLQSPYLFRVTPGKEEKLSIPLTILGLKIQRAWAEKIGMMTPELEADFNRFEEMLKVLASGGEVR